MWADMHWQRRLWMLLAILVLAMSAAPALCQEQLTLQQAVASALRRNPAHKLAVSEVEITRKAANEARASLLPSITFNESALRSNDPVFVFGTRLRQRRFTSADFALNRLNTPTPIGDFSSRFSGQWRLWDGQTWHLVRGAEFATSAKRQQLERADQELIARVVDAYYGALRARKELEIAQHSLQTAEAIVQRSQSRVGGGTALEADLLSARVNQSARQQQVIAAKNAVDVANAQLAILMGIATDSPVEPVEPATNKQFPARTIAELERVALAERRDLKQVDVQRQEQSSAMAAAKAAFGPRVNAFGSWQTNSPSIGWNGGNNWTAGLEVSLDLFAGGSKRARLAGERATAERIEAARQEAVDMIRMEVRRALASFDSARQQVEVAHAAIEEAQESLRVTQNRFDAGLTTLTDLLRVEEAAHRAQTDYWNALYAVQTSFANLQLATGELSPDSLAVIP